MVYFYVAYFFLVSSIAFATNWIKSSISKKKKKKALESQVYFMWKSAYGSLKYIDAHEIERWHVRDSLPSKKKIKKNDGFLCPEDIKLPLI